MVLMEHGGRNNEVCGDSSYEFWRKKDEKKAQGRGFEEEERDGEEFGFQKKAGGEEDPPSKLIGQFLHKQQASGDFSLDVDLEMQELKQDNADMALPPPVVESPLKASVSSEKRPIFSGEVKIWKEEEPQVVRCTSNSSFQSNSSFRRRSRLLASPKNNNKSRLLDPPESAERKPDKSPKSAKSRSGLQQADQDYDDEEDDPFLEEDVPEDYRRRGKVSWFVVLEWVSLVLIVAALICNLTVKPMKLKRLWDLPLWKWEVMVLVLICGRLVSSWGIRISVFFVERNFLLRKRVLYFVYGLRRAVVNSLWLGLVLLAWHLLFDKKVERETNSKALEHVTRVLVCLLVGTMVWLVKTLIVKVLASSFHVSTYFDRIQEALFDQFVIKTLTGPPLIINKDNSDDKIAIEIEELQNAGAPVPPGLRETVRQSSPKSIAAANNSRTIGSGRTEKTPRRGATDKDTITIDHLHRLTPRNVSAWNMKRLMHLVRHDKLMTLDEQLSRSHHTNTNDDDDESGSQINNESEARAAARKIFTNVAHSFSKYIYMEDLMRFMPEDEASKTMSRFEGAPENQRISKSALKDWVVNVFRERRALALTLSDTKTAVNRLHRIVNVLVSIVIFIIWLLILGIASGKFLLLICSQLFLVAFVFGNSCKTAFEAIIFLFVMHPFDVGDRCEIDQVQMVVEEMNILTTVFLRYDNQKIIIPNSLLATKAISNYRRSPDMGDGVEFCVHIATPMETIAAMKERIMSYIEKKSEHWAPAPTIIFKDIEDLNRIRMAVWLKHKMNHHDMGEKWARRALLVEEMVNILKDLDIQYRLMPLDINVRALPSSCS